VPGQPAPRRTTGDFALRRHQPVVVVIAAMPRRAAWGLTPVVSHRAMNCGGTSTSRTLGGLSMTAFLDSPDAHRGRGWRFRCASRAGASRFAPQLAPTLTRRARCETGTATGHIPTHCQQRRAGLAPAIARAAYRTGIVVRISCAGSSIAACGTSLLHRRVQDPPYEIHLPYGLSINAFGKDAAAFASAKTTMPIFHAPSSWNFE
jgi:hypothetical protein